jgi:chromosome segregation ATPase
MAADNKDDLRKKIEEQISKLSKKSAESYREQLRALNAVNASLDAYQNTLEDISDRIADQSQGFAGILEEIQGINEELVKEGKFTRDATKALSGLESIASKLKSDQKGYNDLNQKQLQQEKSKLKILQDQFEESAKRIKQRGAQNAQEQAIIDAYEEQKSIFQRTNGLLDDRIEQEKIYTKNLGATGALLTGMSKIPLVGPLLDVNDALELAREKAKAGGNAFQVMATGLSSVGKSLVTNMLDPLTLVTGLIDTFVNLDKAAGDFAKSQNMTYSDAL